MRCLTAAILFVEEPGGIDLQPGVAGTFLIAVGLMMIALILFLRETRLASQSLRIPRDYLELQEMRAKQVACRLRRCCRGP